VDCHLLFLRRAGPAFVRLFRRAAVHAVRQAALHCAPSLSLRIADKVIREFLRLDVAVSHDLHFDGA
jgi:hypothetical protein